MVPQGWLVVGSPVEAHAAHARGAVVLLPVGDQMAETDRAMAYLSALALAHEASHDPVPVVIGWCVSASERAEALLGTDGRGSWANEVRLGRSGAWRHVRAGLSSDSAALDCVTRRLRRLLSMSTHEAALAGDSERLLSFADRASAGQTIVVPLVACTSRLGAWHGREVLSAALTRLSAESIESRDRANPSMNLHPLS